MEFRGPAGPARHPYLRPWVCVCVHLSVCELLDALAMLFILSFTV